MSYTRHILFFLLLDLYIVDSFAFSFSNNVKYKGNRFSSESIAAEKIRCLLGVVQQTVANENVTELGVIQLYI